MSPLSQSVQLTPAQVRFCASLLACSHESTGAIKSQKKKTERQKTKSPVPQSFAEILEYSQQKCSILRMKHKKDFICEWRWANCNLPSLASLPLTPDHLPNRLRHASRRCCPGLRLQPRAEALRHQTRPLKLGCRILHRPPPCAPHPRQARPR